MTPLCGWLLVLLASPLCHSEGVHAWGGLSTAPSESECRPYIDKALKELSPSQGSQEAVDATDSEQLTTPPQSTDQEGSIEEPEEATTKESIEGNLSLETQAENETASTETEEVTESKEETTESKEETTESKEETTESKEDVTESKEEAATEETSSEHTQTEETAESIESTETQESTTDEIIGEEKKTEDSLEVEQISSEDEHHSTGTDENVEVTSTEETAAEEPQSAETPDDSTNEDKSIEDETKSGEESVEETPTTKEEELVSEDLKLEETSEENPAEQNVSETLESKEEQTEEAASSAEDRSVEESVTSPGVEVSDSAETNDSTETIENKESLETESAVEPTENVEASVEETKESTVEEPVEEKKAEEVSSEMPGGGEETTQEGSGTSEEATPEATSEPTEETATVAEPEVDGTKIDATPTTEGEAINETAQEEPLEEPKAEQESAAIEEAPKELEPTVEDQLTLEFEVPKMRRPREHLAEILRLTQDSAETEMLLSKTIEVTLKDLKKLYDSAIKPLEILYKYRDLSNRHFGDPEIFSKPLILFMGPWSGGKSSIINYLLDNEFKSSSLRTGAEPSPAYFNILMWGEREEVLDGTQLAADWTFSGLQKFGQGLLDRLRGLRLNAPLLEKVNIVEIPGILEIRKQVERLFPFNDACQWFIDRADIIFLVYDPSKLDVGPETEAILDQLKGREYQTRIILNKADQVKPEELMRVQGTLIWNISPLMSSQEPPVMYSTSLWSVPYEQGAPSRLLHAQERAFLRDLRQAVEKRVENKIASARRFAVRVRNHAKMVDCYLTTYYNHKSFFGNRKKVADDIIEHPQNYHIYEGLSTLTNISRYDLPDPEVYRDFFRLNQVFDFQRLSDTCTYFRGCPINRLDVAIAYDLPELVGKFKKQAERVVEAAAAQGKS